MLYCRTIVGMGITYTAYCIRPDDIDRAREHPGWFLHDNPLMDNHYEEKENLLYLSKDWKALEEIFAYVLGAEDEAMHLIERHGWTCRRHYCSCSFSVLEPEKVTRLSETISGIDDIRVSNFLREPRDSAHSISVLNETQAFLRQASRRGFGVMTYMS